MNTTIDMTKVLNAAADLHYNIDELNKAFKRVASAKTRLKQSAGRPDFNEKMTRVLQEEQLLKHVRDYLTEPRKTVSNLTAEDIAVMNYDEVTRAIASIQSKKTHTRWADDCERDDDGMYIPGTGAKYKEACRIERMLQERKFELKPNIGGFSKATLRELIATLRLCSDLDVKTCLDRIEAFMEGGEN